MAEVWWPRGSKRRPGWNGVGFCWDYRCMVGSGRTGLYGAIALIVVVFAVHVAFPMRYFITHGHYWQPIVGILLVLSSLSSLLATHLTDPGILPPRPPPPSAWLREHAEVCAIRDKYVGDPSLDIEDAPQPDEEEVKAATEQVLQSFFSRAKVLPSGSTQLASVYCYTCHHWRSPRAVHCSDCGVGT